jgi:ribosomal protein S15P/S13E
MAALQEIARALRNNFPDLNTSVKLQEIINFIENYIKTSPQDVGRGEKGKPLQNAKNTRKNASTTREEPHQATKISQQQSTAQPQENPQRPRGKTDGATYANIVKRAAGKGSKHPVKQKELPKSLLGDGQKQPATIKISLRAPLKETPKDLIDAIKATEGEQVTTLIRAIRPLNARHLLIHPKDERAKETLLGTKGWLTTLQADIYSRDFPIVIYGMERTEEPEKVLQRLQDQNTSIPGLFIGSWAQWLGKRPTGTSALKIGLKCPIHANKVIQEGLVLDYEIKGVRKYTPPKWCRSCRQPGHKQTQCPTVPKQRRENHSKQRTFFREKEEPISTTFQASQIIPQTMDIDGVEDSQGEWTLIEGTQKRKMIKPRGRPRLFQRIDTSHGDIQGFLRQTPTQIPESPTQGTQTINIDVDTITVASTQ